MPYSVPSPTLASSSNGTTTETFSPSSSRAAFTHRRTRSSNNFSDEKGPGAFISLGALPRSNRKALFHLNFPDDDEDPPSPPDNNNGTPVAVPTTNSTATLQSPSQTLAPRTRINIPRPSTTDFAPDSVPFPTSSPLSPPDGPSPFFPTYQAPLVSSSVPRLSINTSSSSPSASLPRTPSTPVILSNGKPLKSSLKSSSSSPNISHLPVTKHMRAQSAPSTPAGKNVHFAEEKEGLEMVRVFTKGGKPVSVNKPSGEETETETEAESAYPFPPLPSSSLTSSSPSSVSSSASQPTIYELDPMPGMTSPVPQPSPSPYANIHLETLVLPRTRPPLLRGTVVVRNMSFEKTVAVRFTMDAWQTTSEVLCGHNASLPSLPPPFPRPPRTMGDVAGGVAVGRKEEKEAEWDRFSFTIRLEDYEHNLATRTLWLVARYVPGSGGEFWDNNEGRNYRVNFRRALRVASTGVSPLGSPAGSSLGLVGMFKASLSPPEVTGLIAGKKDKEDEGEGEVHAQQRTFSAPSTLRTTPTTGAVAAHGHGHARHHHRAGDHGYGRGFANENLEQREYGFRLSPGSSPGVSAVPLARSMSLPTASTTLGSSPDAPPSFNTAAGPTAASFVARRLSLTNYAKPSASALFGIGGSGMEMEMSAQMGAMPEEGSAPVTPPMTPPGGEGGVGRVRRQSLPVIVHSTEDEMPEGDETAAEIAGESEARDGAILSPVSASTSTSTSTADSSTVSTPSTITPGASRGPLSPLVDFPWSPIGSFGFAFGGGFGGDGVKYQPARGGTLTSNYHSTRANGGLLSPPRSLDNSPAGSGQASPVRRRRSPSPPTDTASGGSPSNTGPPAPSSLVQLPVAASSRNAGAGFGLGLGLDLSSLQNPTANVGDDPEGLTSPRVDPSDSSYAAFVRQWCFAGAGGSVGSVGASTSADTSSGSDAGSPSSTNSPASSTPSASSTLFVPSDTGAGAGPDSSVGERGFGMGGLHHHKNQSHHSRGGNAGYSFPGFGFGMVDTGMVGAYMR